MRANPVGAPDHLRVAFVNSLRVAGGGEKWVVRHAGLWQERGVAVRVLCNPGSGLERLAREAGLPVESLPLRHDVSPSSVLALARALRCFRPSAILCCNERAFRLAAPARLLAGRRPLLYRNGLTGTFKNRLHNRLLFPALACMVANTEAIRREVAAFGWVPPERLRVICNGIRPEQYDPDPAARARLRSELGTSGDAVVLAVLARVTAEKGHRETLAAFRTLAPRHPLAELWIAGEGDLTAELETTARAAGLASRVRFLGFRSDVPALLSAVDLVVQASHREGLGNSLLEAMAACLPVVASAVGGTPDVVLDGATGLLVPPHDVPALSAALDRVLADASLRTALGQAGRTRVEQEFRLEAEADAWLELLRNTTR